MEDEHAGLPGLVAGQVWGAEGLPALPLGQGGLGGGASGPLADLQGPLQGQAGSGPGAKPGGKDLPQESPADWDRAGKIVIKRSSKVRVTINTRDVEKILAPFYFLLSLFLMTPLEAFYRQLLNNTFLKI